MFFGDNSFGWFPAELLVDFAEHLEEKAKQKTGNKARSLSSLDAAICSCRIPCGAGDMARIRIGAPGYAAGMHLVAPNASTSAGCHQKRLVSERAVQ